MMGPGLKIAKKIIEFLACLSCCIGKYLTDLEARRVFLTRQKWSREWSLLHTVFWDNKGDAFAWITYGGFTIISLLFGISICIDSKSRSTISEKIFLLIGALMFFAVGGIVFAAIDQIPGELIDNAIVLGCLSFFVAFLFLVDLSEPSSESSKRKTDATQTDSSSIDRHFTKSQSSTTINSQANLMESHINADENKTLDSIRSTESTVEKSSINNPFITIDQLQQQQQKQINSINSRGGNSAFSEDVIESHSLPSMQLPVFSKVKPSQNFAVSHLKREPFRKSFQSPHNISSNSYMRYHDTTLLQQDPAYYDDDINNYRKRTYYEGTKVDQGKLIIRNLSEQVQSNNDFNCQNPHEKFEEAQVEMNGPIKVGYVHHVAKLWDSRTIGSSSGESNQKSLKGLSTIV